MLKNFEWRVEEDERWEEEPARQPPPRTPRGRRWAALVLIAAALLLAALLLYREAEKRTAAAAAAAEADVAATHALVQRAARERDTELLGVTLSGRDPVWGQTQRELLARGLLFTPAGLGLRPLPLPSPPPSVTLSPDLSTAEVRFPQRYVLNVEEGMTTTLTLLQTAVYRRGEEHWLLAPPEADFWGGWERQVGRHLSLAYPARDREVAVRLAGELEAQLAEMCRELADLACPEALHVELRLESDPAGLLALEQTGMAGGSGLFLELPAPTLVGLPTDEAGYRLLYRHYASRVVRSVITELVGYDCCAHTLFYHALLDKQLHRLGLLPWPMTAEAYEQLLLDSFQPGEMWRAWTEAGRPESGWQPVYALVDFLEERNAPAGLAGMQRQLGQAGSYTAWLEAVLGRPPDLTRFAEEWLAFVYHQTPSAGQPLPADLPAQDIQLTCGFGANSEAGIYRYSLQAGTWSSSYAGEVALSNADLLIPLPRSEGFVRHSEALVDGRLLTRTVLHRRGEAITLFEAGAGTGSFMYFTGLSDPSGRYLVLVRVGSSAETAIYIVDLEECTPGRCPLHATPGVPVWSPGSRQTLLFDAGSSTRGLEPEQWQTPLYRAGANGGPAIAINQGREPFWLDEGRYGYVRLGGAGGEEELELVLAAVGEDKPAVLLQASDLLEALPEAERPERLIHLGVMSAPESRLLAVSAVAAPGTAGRAYLFLLEVEAESPALRSISFLRRSDSEMAASFSPDGRWLAASVPTRAGDRLVTLFDSGGRQHNTFRSGASIRFTSGWSADGRWFLLHHYGYLLLLDVAHNYFHLVPYDYANCNWASWIERP